MCEINPKHALYFRLEAFTSHPDITKEEFDAEVPRLVLEAEIELNKSGRYRFHVHPEEEFTQADVALLDDLIYKLHGPKMDALHGIEKDLDTLNQKIKARIAPVIEDETDDRCPTCRAEFDEPHFEGCPDAPAEVTGHDVDAVDDLFDRSDWPPERTS